MADSCLCESHDVPPQSPLWGYQTSPGINKYDSTEKEIFLGEYFQYGPTQGELRRERVIASQRPATPPPAAYVAPESPPPAEEAQPTPPPARVCPPSEKME